MKNGGDYKPILARKKGVYICVLERHFRKSVLPITVIALVVKS